MTVIGIFGPTASGKSRVAETVAERIPAELVSADAMQVYRGLPILTNQSPRPARRRSGRSTRRPRSASTRRSPTRRSTRSSPPAGRRSSSAGPASTSAPRSPTSTCRRRRRPGARERWAARLRRRTRQRAHERLAELDPAAAAAVHRERPAPRRAGARARRGRRVARAGDRPPLGGGDAPPDARRRPRRAEGRARAADRGAHARDVRRRRRRTRCGARSPAPISTTARKTLGLDEVAALPREEAIEAIVVRTRRYAAYQRKWMRRVPGLVMVDADRPPGEIADDIVALARTRERLPRR